MCQTAGYLTAEGFSLIPWQLSDTRDQGRCSLFWLHQKQLPDPKENFSWINVSCHCTITSEQHSLFLQCLIKIRIQSLWVTTDASSMHSSCKWTVNTPGMGSFHSLPENIIPVAEQHCSWPNKYQCWAGLIIFNAALPWHGCAASRSRISLAGTCLGVCAVLHGMVEAASSAWWRSVSCMLQTAVFLCSNALGKCWPPEQRSHFTAPLENLSLTGVKLW